MGGLPGVTMVGLLDPTVREESRDPGVRTWRVRNSGFPFPADARHGQPRAGRPPQDRRGVRSRAVAAQRAGGRRRDSAAPIRAASVASWGGVSLDGRVCRRCAPVCCPIAAAAPGAPPAPGLMFPAGKPRRGRDCPRPSPVPRELAAPRGDAPPARPRGPRRQPTPHPAYAPAAPRRMREDLSATCAGRCSGRRALEIAAAGAHHLLLIGPPGSGKTMLAQRGAGRSCCHRSMFDEALHESTIHSVAKLALEAGTESCSWSVHFARPTHVLGGSRSSAAARFPRPGELGLAHLGVLFLDELPGVSGAARSKRSVKPLEQRTVHIARAARTVPHSPPR